MAGFQVTLHGRIWVTAEGLLRKQNFRDDDLQLKVVLFEEPNRHSQAVKFHEQFVLWHGEKLLLEFKATPK